ncbi:MAG: hypothetical protein VW905_05930, partial [Gammaproteobacteria bacterium]
VFANTVLELIRERCSSLKDFLTLTDYFFEDPIEFDAALIDKHIKEETFQYLVLLSKRFQEVNEWKSENIKEAIEIVVKEHSIGFAKIGLPLRLALTATVNSPSIDLICEVLGKDVTERRLDSFLAKIKG